MMKDYRLIDHTADIAIKVHGDDIKSLFLNCGYALFDLLYETKGITPTDSLTLSVEGIDEEELLVNFMRELFFQFSIYKLVLNEIEITALNENEVTATVSYEALDMARHKLKNDIKAVTYHDVRIEQRTGRRTGHTGRTGKGLSVVIVFDT